MSREEEIITLQQFLRFGETKSIVELMAIQEKEGQAVTVPSSKADSGIRTFIESNSRARSPGLLSHLESSSPSSIHHFENIPNSLAFLLPFQYISPMSAPMLGLPPNGLTLEQSGLARMREAGLPGQSETVESSESEVSLSPFCGAQSPSRGAVGALLNPIEPKIEPNRSSPVSPSPSVHTPHTPQPQSGPLNNHQIHHHFDKNDQSKGITHSSFSSKMHRMRRMGATSRKGRVCCNSCGKTFYDKGTLKIHYNAVHLKIKHRCTIEGCNMVFSSLRSRNRHSANPNPRLHMPMLRNNRDKDLIRSGSGTTTPVISSAKSGFNLTSPGRPSLGFATPPLEPLHFPSLKSVQPVQPVPPFYRTLLSPANLVSPPVSLPNSPILPNATTGASLLETPSQMFVGTHHNVVSECTPAFPPCLPTTQESSALDHAPKKKPRKSSMPVKIEKDVIDVAEDYEDRDEYESEDRHRLQPHVLHNNLNGNCNNNNNSSDGHRAGGSEELSPCQDALRGLLPEECEGSTGGGELHRADSFTSEDQDHERDFENESETSEARTLCRDELVDRGVQPALFRSEEQGLRKATEEQSQFLAAQHQPLVRIKEEASDPTYDMFCMGQYSLYNGSMAALHESFITSMAYGTSPTKFPSHSPDSDICSDPKICYVCKKSFKSSYSVKLHYKNVHLKEMHVCTVAGCNAAFPSRRSRDRHSSNINLHRKLLTKELDELILDPQLSVLPMDLRAELLAKVYGQRLSGGRAAPPDDDYVALDLSTASSVQSSGSLRSWRDSDEGSDEGVLLDEPDASSDAEDAPRGLTEEAAKGGSEEGLLFRGPSFSPSVLASGVVCGICQKMYSNRGTLRVHYKTVHLREMHKCKVQGCNVMFSSVRSRNRHSQNPNLHKNVSG